MQLCVLGNLCPETVEEAIAMVPSIKVYPTHPTFASGLYEFVNMDIRNASYEWYIVSQKILKITRVFISGKSNLKQ